MNNTFYFLRHGATQRDRNVPISQWKLSEKGAEQARILAQQDIFDKIDIIFLHRKKSPTKQLNQLQIH